MLALMGSTAAAQVASYIPTQIANVTQVQAGATGEPTKDTDDYFVCFDYCGLIALRLVPLPKLRHVEARFCWFGNTVMHGFRRDAHPFVLLDQGNSTRSKR
jgi:hypothetical protein